MYLVQGTDSGLKNQVGVEEEGAQQRLRVSRQLSQDTGQQQVDIQGVREHVLQSRQQHTDEGTCGETDTDTVSLLRPSLIGDKQ